MQTKLFFIYTDDWKDIADISISNAMEYCQRHKYQCGWYNPKGIYNGFDKISMIQEAFRFTGVGTAWSLDCDTLITNHNYKIEDYLQDGKDFYICKDINGLNAGSFIVRKTEWSMWFLDWLMQWMGIVDCEQNAIDKYFEKFQSYENICILPHPSINSMPYNLYAPSFGKIGYKEGDEVKEPTHEQGNWKMGDFVLHLPGMSLEKRLNILKETPIVK